MAVARVVGELMKRSSWIRKMFETGRELKAAHGEDRVCDFSLGNPSIDPPREFTQALAELGADRSPGAHSYMPNAGYPDVRQAVAREMTREQKCEVDASGVIMTCGAGGGLNVALKSVINPGDEVVAGRPCFMEYAFYAGNHGGNLRIVDCAADFDLDVDAIEAAVSDRTAAVIVNSPNNPSGRVYPEATLQALGAMLTRKSRDAGRTIYLISDEPYRKIVFDEVQVPSVMEAYRHSVVVTSCSKDLSIPGERIGWIAVHPQAEDGETLVNAMILCNRILGSVNAPALMQRVVARAIGSCVDVDIYRRKRDILSDALQQAGYDLQKPEGTFYLFPRAPGGDDVEFVERLQQQLILAVPGRGFDMPGYFRIAYCVDDEVITRSFDGFRRAMDATT